MCLTFFEACDYCAGSTQRLWVVQPCKERAYHFALAVGARRWVTCGSEAQLNTAIKCGVLVPMRTVHTWTCRKYGLSRAATLGTRQCTTTWSDVGKNLDHEELQQLSLEILRLRSGKLVTDIAEEAGGKLLVDSSAVYQRLVLTTRTKEADCARIT